MNNPNCFERIIIDNEFEIRGGHELCKYVGDGGDVVIPNGITEIWTHACMPK